MCIVFRQCLTMQSRLSWNLRLSCVSLLSAGITGVATMLGFPCDTLSVLSSTGHVTLSPRYHAWVNNGPGGALCSQARVCSGSGLLDAVLTSSAFRL